MKRCLLLILSVVLCAVLCGCDFTDYRDATALYEQGQWEEAAAVFESLGDYKDSPEMISACRYGKATDLYTAGNFADAVAIFEALGDYSDSPHMVNACRYSIAQDLFSQALYEAAGSGFAALGDYEDSREMVSRCNFLSLYTHILHYGAAQGDGSFRLEKTREDGAVLALTVDETHTQTIVLSVSKTESGEYDFTTQVILPVQWGEDEAAYTGINTTRRTVGNRSATDEERFTGTVKLSALTEDFVPVIEGYTNRRTNLYGLVILQNDLQEATAEEFFECFTLLLTGMDEYLKDLAHGAHMQDLGLTAWN